MKRMSTKESIININQILQLTDLEICETDINWSKVKMNSFRWIAVRHQKISIKAMDRQNSGFSQSQMSLNSDPYYPHLFNASYRNNRSVDDLNNMRDTNENSYHQNSNGTDSAAVESMVTVVNPFTKQFYNCQTGCDTKCAQISPDSDMIAISNDKYIAVYCVQTNKCVNTLPFQYNCLFWNWINNNLIVIITEKEVYHWNIDSYLEPELKFKLDPKLKDSQITGYKCDQTNELWFAITSLYNDDEEDEISGLVQIYSECYQLSQCIEAHACCLSKYKFNANQSPTQVLLAAKRNQLNTFKIYIIELGPIKEGNCSLISRTEVLPQVNSDSDDFPVSIECNSELGLIYLFSKYGSLFICDIESGALIISTQISSTVIFTTCFDVQTHTALAIGRNGQLLAIQLYIEYLLRHLNNISKKDVAQRIQTIINTNSKYNTDDEDCDEVTRL